MDARKLQKTGGSSLAIALPKKWAVASGLRAGDTVFLEPLADGSLAVRPREMPSGGGRRKTLAVGEEEPRTHLFRRLIGAYISGFDVIELKFPPEIALAVRRVAREFTRAVIGPEVLEESRGALILKDLSDASELSAEKCLRRMYLTAKAMHEDALAVLRTGDPQLAKDVEQRDQDVDRLFWVVSKQYNMAHLWKIIPGPDWVTTGIHNYWLVAKFLERIADHAVRIALGAAELAGKVDPRLEKELQAASHGALAMLDGAFGAMISGDVDAANRAVDLAEPFRKRVESLVHRLPVRRGPELLTLGAIAESIGRTAGYAADIAELAINDATARADTVRGSG